MRRGAKRRPGGRGLISLALAASLMTLLPPTGAVAADPEPAGQEGALHSGAVALARPELALRPIAALPGASTRPLLPPIYAKRAKDRSFDTSLGEEDPRKRELPRTHRFRLTLHAQWVRLTQTQNPATGKNERFHFAPLMIDVGYQAQFLKFVMVRVALAAGGNVANTRNAMAAAVFPQAYVGFQSKVFGLAFGYGYDITIPATVGATANTDTALEQPVITNNHVVMGELSLTARIDRSALTFSLAIGGVKSKLVHYATANNKFRPYFGFQMGAFFDGTLRRAKKARKARQARKTQAAATR